MQWERLVYRISDDNNEHKFIVKKKKNGDNQQKVEGLAGPTYAYQNCQQERLQKAVHKTETRKVQIAHLIQRNLTQKWSEKNMLLTIHNSEQTVIIEPMNKSKWAAPIVTVLKPDNCVRLCGDYMLTWPMLPWASPDTCHSTDKTASSRTTTKVRSTFMGMEAVFIGHRWTLRVCVQGKSKIIYRMREMVQRCWPKELDGA